MLITNSKHTCTYTLTRTHTHTHTRTHARTHARAHTHTHTHLGIGECTTNVISSAQFFSTALSTAYLPQPPQTIKLKFDIIFQKRIFTIHPATGTYSQRNATTSVNIEHAEHAGNTRDASHPTPQRVDLWAGMAASF